MKKRNDMTRWITLILLCVAATVSVRAQEGLEVAPFFSDAYASNGKVTMVTMSGDQLGGSGISRFRSISVSGDPELSDMIEKAVRKDGISAGYKETSYKEGKLHFGFYSLGGKGARRRYLLYLNRTQGSGKTTLVYIRGDLSPEEVKKMIVKKIK